MKKNLLHKIISFSVLVLFALNANCQYSNKWLKKQSLTDKIERAVGFSIGDKGYIGTGQDSTSEVRNDFWQYDPVLDSWMQKASIPAVGRRNAAGFSIGGKGYIGTGIDDDSASIGNTLNDFWAYDTTNNQWTQKSFYGSGWQGVYSATGFSIGTKGYICCGKIGASNFSDELWQYNPTNDSWTQKTSFPGGTRFGLVSFVIADSAYVGTGTDENSFTKDFWRYSPATNSWKQISDLPGSARYFCSAFTLNGKGYVALGNDGGDKDELWQYIPENDSWTNFAPFGGGARHSAIAFTIGNRAFAGTGNGSGSKRDLWEFLPPYPAGTNEMQDAGYKIQVEPNPSDGKIQVIGNRYSVTGVEIYNVLGEKIYQPPITQLPNYPITIDISNQPKGIYFVKVITNTGVANKKVVVR